MPDEPTHLGDIQIAIDPAMPDGPIAFATRNPDGTVNVQVATVGDDGNVHVTPRETVGDVIGHVVAGADVAAVDLSQFDVGRFTDVGWTSDDGLTFPGAEDPPPSFANGGLISTTVRAGQVSMATSGCISPAAMALYTGDQPWLSVDQLRAEAQRVNDEVERRARLNLYPSGGRRRTRPDDSGRPAEQPAGPVTPAPDGDVLDRIDAAVDELCACGCRIRVPADGASAYFATAACQRRWHGRQATNPAEVYNRGDAADVYVGADAAPVPLREHNAPTAGSVVDDLIRRGASGTIRTGRPAREDPHANHVHVHMTRRRDAPPPCPDPHGVAYRRACSQCGQRVIPRPVVADPAEQSFTDRFFNSDLRLECPTCEVELPGPVLIADVSVAGNRMLLILGGGEVRTKRLVYLNRLTAIPRNAPGRDDYIGYLWRSMERELEEFQRRWVGNARRLMVETRIGMSVMNPRSSLMVTDV